MEITEDDENEEEDDDEDGEGDEEDTGEGSDPRRPIYSTIPDEIIGGIQAGADYCSFPRSNHAATRPLRASTALCFRRLYDWGSVSTESSIRR